VISVVLGRSTLLARFLLLFSALYLAFGAASPFLPAFLASRGLTSEQIGLLLFLATAIRLVSGPTAGHFADRLEALRTMLTFCLALAGTIAICFVPATGIGMLVTVVVLHAGMLAPTTFLADALALGSANRHPRGGFEYGWVRGAGSAAFIVGSLVSGQVLERTGAGAPLLMQGMLLILAAAAAMLVPELVRLHDGRPPVPEHAAPYSVRRLLRVPAFTRIVLIASLILGSHALHDSFAMISWNAAGIRADVGSILWSTSVAAEVIVFLAIGPVVLRYIKPELAMTIAAVAAVLRWGVMAQTTHVLALALVEPLHGLTFALLHMSCMRVLSENVPPALAATAQSIYSTIGIGATTAVLTLLSGAIYPRLGASAFWIMAALAAAALPWIWSLSLVLYPSRGGRRRQERLGSRVNGTKSP
jgi:MFS transporter, PPP family, 3-phenylpropionic acid transporter